MKKYYNSEIDEIVSTQFGDAIVTDISNNGGEKVCEICIFKDCTREECQKIACSSDNRDDEQDVFFKPFQISGNQKPIKQQKTEKLEKNSKIDEELKVIKQSLSKTQHQVKTKSSYQKYTEEQAQKSVIEEVNLDEAFKPTNFVMVPLELDNNPFKPIEI